MVAVKEEKNREEREKRREMRCHPLLLVHACLSSPFLIKMSSWIVAAIRGLNGQVRVLWRDFMRDLTLVL